MKPHGIHIDDWGFPRSGGRTHQGNDIFAPTGTPIRSPFDGRADEGSGGLGGIYVFVYSDAGDHVYNAHMSRFAGVDGQRVTKGQVIGYVGNSGNAVGTPPHNHFGYYPGNGAAVNPYPYLNEVCGDGGRGF
jgi:murein DD-endopeptidase MepM/ murein hydrolase activator NlpD